MNSPVVAVALSLFFALVVLVVLVRAHVPAEGIFSWTREAVSGGRKGAAASTLAVSADAEAEDLRVVDMLGLAEQGSAYHQPVDLLSVVDRVRSR